MNKNRKIIILIICIISILATGCVSKMVIPEDGVLQTKSLYEIHKMQGRFVSYEEYQEILKAHRKENGR